MSRKIIKFTLTTMGLALLIGCIAGEIDGVGRFALIFGGVVSIYIGFFIKEK